MMQQRFIPRPTCIVHGVAFETAEDAWLWATYAIKFANDGAQLTANQSSLRRPCEPRDMINLACRLRREGVLSGREIGALCRFGTLDRPPDPRDPAEEKEFHEWDRALDKMLGQLIKKGIVLMPEPHPNLGESNSREKNKT